MKIIVDLDAYTRPELSSFGEPPLASDAVRLRALLSQLLDLGITDFLSPSDPRLLETLWTLRSQCSFTVTPLLVDAARQGRALQTYGFVGFARRRLLAAGAVGAIRASLEAFPHLPSLARRDYVDGSLFLAALELSQFARFRPRRAFLHANSSDLATANRNERLFRGFLRLARRRSLDAGVVTNNAGRLLPLLEEWDLSPMVAMPVAASGYHMKPSREETMALAGRSRRPLIAVLPRCEALSGLVDLSRFEAVIASPPDAVTALAMLDPRGDAVRS